MSDKGTVERGIAQAFIQWFSSKGIQASILTQQERPDFIFEIAGKQLGFEVTVAYYDIEHAKFIWKNLKDDAKAPKSVTMSNPDAKLIGAINRALDEKCSKDYPDGCALGLWVDPRITTAEEFEIMRHAIVIPNNRFAAIYLAGIFPISSTGPGGLRGWTLKEGV